MKTILVGTDGSRGARIAVRTAIELARNTGASLTFVGVRPPPLPVLGDPYYQQALSDDLMRIRNAVRDAAAEAELHGITAEYELPEGDPATELLRLADFREADMVIVGSRGHGAFVSAILGSVSRRMVREARCPVLVAKERVHEPRPTRQGRVQLRT